jgi:imidazolonepropionase-like amidohydrolase
MMFPSQILRGLLVAAALFGGAAQASVNVPAAPQTTALFFTNATLHTVSGAVIPNGQMLVERGRISALGISLNAPAGARVMDLAGKHIYPGMIAANTVMGLAEVSSVRATLDFAEVGTINPNARALVAVNPDSESIPVTRANGIVAALTVPGSEGSLIGGTSALLQLDGWTWEEMGLVQEVALHVNLPQMRFNAALFPPPLDARLEEARKLSTQRIKMLEDAFDHAAAYGKARAAGEQSKVDVRWESMLPVIAGTRPVFMHAHDITQIRYAIAFAERYKLKLVIVGGADAWQIADLLRERAIPVIVAGVHNLPLRRGEPYDTPFRVAAMLAQAGVQFCIARNSSDFDTPHERNLPYEAATAAAFGLSREDALKAITLYPAQILGVADKLGSLDAGKMASFIVTDGDPLETATKIEQVYIQGRAVDLSNRHTRLNEKYLQKYQQKAADKR